MLAGIDPVKFAEWEAEHRIQPWGDDWPQISTLAASIINEIRLATAGETRPKLLPNDWLIPKLQDIDDEDDPNERAIRKARLRAGL